MQWFPRKTDTQNKKMVILAFLCGVESPKTSICISVHHTLTTYMKFCADILHGSKVTEGDRPTDRRTDRPTDKTDCRDPSRI